MPLYETYLRGRLVVPEFQPIDVNEIYRKRGSRRLIPANTEKDITPMAMQLRPSQHFWGCTYEVLTYDDEMGTGTVRMRANSAFAWGLVYKPEDDTIVPVLGSHTFPMGPCPESRELFIFARRTREGAVIDKLLEWRLPRRARP